MALPLWGVLEKAQDDSETIEQAIARLIDEHKADPTAHLGVGESLEQHKTSSIIDHPPESVVLDKLPFTQYDEFKADLGSHGWSFEEGTGSATSTLIDVSLFSQSEVLLIGNTNHLAGSNYPDADLMYQFYCRLTGASSSDGVLYFTWDVDGYDSDDRISIEKDGTNFYFRIYVSGSVVAEQILPNGSSNPFYMRLWFDSANDMIRFYLGSTQAFAYYMTSWRDLVASSFTLYTSRTSNNQIGFRITDWKMIYNIDVDI